MSREVERTSEWVSATARENAWAGIGAGIVVQVFQGFADAFFSYPLSERSVLYSVLCGFGVFGLLCLVRFTMDEWRLVWDARDRAVAVSMIAELEATVAELRSELKRVHREVRGQEFRLAAGSAREVVQAELEDDDRLRSSIDEVLSRWEQGVSYSRDSCAMSKAEWATAMLFLHDAGVVEKGGLGGRQWVFCDGVDAVHARVLVHEQFERRLAGSATNFVAP